MFNAKTYSREGCSIFTSSLEEKNEVSNRQSKMEYSNINEVQELSSNKYLITKSGLFEMVRWGIVAG